MTADTPRPHRGATPRRRRPEQPGRRRRLLLLPIMAGLLVLSAGATTVQPTRAALTDQAQVDTELSAAHQLWWATGSNSSGRWGEPTPAAPGSATTPIAVWTSEPETPFGSDDVTEVAAGSNHGCAVAAGAAYCWGDNTAGKLGNNSTEASNGPTAVHPTWGAATVTDIAVSASHSCAVAGGKVYCWGANGSGQLGNGTTEPSSIPVEVSDGNDGATPHFSNSSVTKVAVGGNVSCAIASGRLYCWGANDIRQLGVYKYNQTPASSVTRPAKVLTNADVTWQDVRNGNGVANPYHEEDNLWMLPWASNATVYDVSTNGTTTCAVADDLTRTLPADGEKKDVEGYGMFCWGSNSNGQVGIWNRRSYRHGNGSDSNPDSFTVVRSTDVQPTPIKVDHKNIQGSQLADTGKTRATAIAVGATSVCGLASNALSDHRQVPYCWGRIGTGSMPAYNAAGPADNALVAQIGTGNIIATTSFTAAYGRGGPCNETTSGGLATVVQGNCPFVMPRKAAIAATAFPLGVTTKLTTTAAAGSAATTADHFCLTVSNAADTVRCWGTNTSGQIGIGSTTTSNTPRTMTNTAFSGRAVASVAAGLGHTLIATTKADD